MSMNIPSIHPTLTMTKSNGTVIDQVFQYVPMTDVPFYNVDVYYDEDYNHKSSQKEMSLEDVRKWWNTLVKKGYNIK